MWLLFYNYGAAASMLKEALTNVNYKTLEAAHEFCVPKPCESNCIGVFIVNTEDHIRREYVRYNNVYLCQYSMYNWVSTVTFFFSFDFLLSFYLFISL